MQTSMSNGVRRTADIRSFLKEAQNSTKGIKYASEKGKTHKIFIPYVNMAVTDDDGNVVGQQAVTISEMHQVHEWIGKDGKFHSALCLSELGADCPFCNRVSDSWDIYKYRYDEVKAELMARGMTEEQADYEMEGDKERRVGAKQGKKKQLLDERKMKENKYYFYMLVALYDTDTSGNPIMEDGLPKYELKVMKLSENRAKKFSELCEGQGIPLEGTEFQITYSNTEDAAERVGQSTIQPTFVGNRITDKFPNIQQKILEDAANFSWVGIEKAFGELTEYTRENAAEMCDDNFRTWDTYKKELEVNPAAHYLEYKNGNTAASTPSLNTAGAVPAPQIGEVHQPQMQTAPNVGGVTAPQVQSQAQPQVQSQAQPQVQSQAQPGFVNGLGNGAPINLGV